MYACDMCGRKDRYVDMHSVEVEYAPRIKRVYRRLLCEECWTLVALGHSRDEQVNRIANNEALAKGVRIA